MASAHGGPFVDEAQRASSDSGPPSQFEWQYEGLGALLYIGLVFATAVLPERIRHFATPLALLSPILFWLGFMVFKG